MLKLFIITVAAATIGLVYSEIQSAAVISKPIDSTDKNLVIPNDLKDFLIDFQHATSKDLLSSLTGDKTKSKTPIPSDWQTAINFMYKYKEVVLFDLLNVYPSLPDNENKVMIHNAVMEFLEDHKTDDRIHMLLQVRLPTDFNLRPHLSMLTKCNPYLALLNWENDTDSISEEYHNAHSHSERLEPQITNSNFTDILMALNNYPESYWASLLPETSESAESTDTVLASIDERFLKYCDLIDVPKVVEFIEKLPNDSIGNNVKKTMLYSALLSVAKTEGRNGESEVFTYYFDVALSFDEFSQNLIVENDYFKNLIKSIKDKYNSCYKSVMHGGSNVFMIKNDKYGEYLYTQSVNPQRMLKYKPSDISQNLYTPIFSWRQLNRTIGFKWEIKREKNRFWLRSIEFDRYMDTTRGVFIHSTYGDVALPELAVKIVPYSKDTENIGFCRIMNVHTGLFLFAGGDDAAEDLDRRRIFCGISNLRSDEDIFNWQFEEFSSV